MVAGLRPFAAVAAFALLLGGCALGEPLTSTGVSQTNVTLRGNVYSNFDGNTEYWWLYGGTKAYGQSTPHRAVAIHDEDPHPVSESLTGLAPNTTYHFQLCARDEQESPPRTNCSLDGTFSTASAIGASRIAFTRFGSTGAEIFAMGSTGAAQVPLTGTPTTYDGAPAWSPDRNKVAFSSDEGGNVDIRTVDADGTGPARLTTDSGGETDPDWSPDGSRIVFVGQRAPTFDSELYVMDADGTDVVRITDSPADSVEPAWSPDGTKILFRRAASLYTVSPAGGIPSALPNLAGFGAAEPAWSADGARIAFSSAVGSTSTNIFVANSDGSDITRLTSFAGPDEAPTWSPDGRKLAFVSRRGGVGEQFDEIWVMDADGSDQVQLTSNSVIDDQPDWSTAP